LRLHFWLYISRVSGPIKVRIIAVLSGLEQAIEKAEFENECRDGTQSNLADDAEGIKEAAHVS